MPLKGNLDFQPFLEGNLWNRKQLFRETIFHLPTKNWKHKYIGKMYGGNLRVKLEGCGNYSYMSFLIANKQITSLWCLDLNGRFNSENGAHSRANV